MIIYIFIYIIILVISIVTGMYEHIAILLLIAGIPVLIFSVCKIVKIIGWINDRTIINKLKKEHERELTEEKTRRNQEREMRKQQHEALVQHYANSRLLKEILNAVTDGNYIRVHPEQILIFKDRIESRINGRISTYDFISHRVPQFDVVGESCYSGSDEQFIVRPQVAAATAINQLLGYEYEIIDRAKRELIMPSDSDRESYYFYSADFVELRLTAKYTF